MKCMVHFGIRVSSYFQNPTELEAYVFLCSFGMNMYFVMYLLWSFIYAVVVLLFLLVEFEIKISVKHIDDFNLES